MAKISSFTKTVYRNAPVAEVALLVQFKPLEKLINKDLVELWANTELKTLYPELSEYGEMPAFFEPFDAESKSQPAKQRPLLLRFNYRNPILAEQFQVQRNRAGFYWQKAEGIEYPHFGYVVDKFWRDYRIMERFLEDNDLGVMNPDQCAVSYNNRIPSGMAWKNAADLADVVTFLSEGVSRPPKHPLELESVAAMRVYTIRSKPPARMYVTFNESPGAPREMDLEFIVRGAPKAPNDLGIQGFFKIAHDRIVDMFECLTRTEMHKLWDKQ